METRYFVDLEVERVGAALWYTPAHLRSHLLLGAVYHVKLVVVLDANHEFVRRVLDSPGHVPICKVGLCQRHQQLKSALVHIALQLAKEHAVVPAETDFALPARYDNVKDCVHLQRLCLKYLSHVVDFDDINVAEVLAKDEELFFDTVMLVLKQLDVVDPLLQLLVVLLLESVDIEHKEVAVVAPDPGQIVVHAAAEKPMATGLLHNNGAQVLVIHVQLVAFAARKDHPRVVCCARRNEGTSPVDN